MSAFNHEASRHDGFRDRADDSFEQITWSQRGLGTSQLIPGMIMGGGTTGDLIRAIPTRHNIVFAAGGKDTIVVNGLKTRFTATMARTRSCFGVRVRKTSSPR